MSNYRLGGAAIRVRTQRNGSRLFAQPAFLGQGYATEAARASLQFGFEHFDLDHIIALVHPDNLGSRRVIEKCGMTCMENKVLWGLEMMRYCVEKTDWKVEKARSNVRDSKP